MADIFISYSNTDKSTVRHFAELLESRGWSVWWDNDIPIGQRFDNVIESELRNAKCVLVIWTGHSVASEWVKNEASDAAQRGVLVPVILENVNIPVAFKRIESAMMQGWDGNSDHPELVNLLESVSAIINRKTDGNSSANLPSDNKIIRYDEARKKRLFAIIFGSLALVLTAMAIAWFWPTEKIVAIRVVDWKGNPIIDGEVKIDLKTYTRSQSIDKTGQALFTGVPAEILKKNLKLVVSGAGYTTKSFDTLVKSETPMKLTLPLLTRIFIRGRVKTAGENPIRGVEINVDGTKYYAISISDGSFNLRVDDYTLGDEITITTSHEAYEDKTFSLRINSPEITNQDIVLNPVLP